jgi:sorting nexin-17
MINSQPFPPKKLFHLSLRETDERRLLLERYLQSIVQNKSLISSSYLNNFFLNAQRETILNECIEKTFPEKISFTFHLLNQHEITINNLSPYDSTNIVLDACIQKMQIDKEYLSYFSLFLYENKNQQQLNLIRPLFSFESPYFSLIQTKKIIENICIVFKKSYWDLSYDSKLLDNRRLCRLLFIQSQYDIEQSKDYYPSDIYDQLENYNQENSFKEYISLSRTSKFYGYILLKECSINDLTGERLSRCLLAIGNNELICYLYDDEKNLFSKEILFKVTRIRCWKVNWTEQDLNIAFEYLMKKDTLQWIIIHTEQAALVSTCLQSMIDEILAKKAGGTSPVSALYVSNDQTNLSNGLTTRTKSDLDRLNNNKLFDEGGGDDDL